jgi:Protein of unknown function (DUF3386)
MKRLVTVVVLLAIAAPVRAHFIWILPPEPPGQPARLVFSDSLHPDNPELLKKIARTELFLFDPNGQATPVKLTEAKDTLEVAMPPDQGPQLLGGICRYGVVQRGQAEPFLLMYYPKAITRAPGLLGRGPSGLLGKPLDKLPLQVVTAANQSIQAVWHGKPLAGAEVTVLLPGQDKPVTGKTGPDGTFGLARPSANGVVGIRISHIENADGELDGKKYKTVKHYATLTIPVLLQTEGSVATSSTKVEPLPGMTENPAATKMLADARGARANWENFPGFSADLEVNFDGRVDKGTVTVDSKGKVTLQMSAPAAANWARYMLRSIVGHRLADGSDLNTPCAFADDVADHPLGRAIRVLNDEFHSSYRIRDRQVIEVNRLMKDSRFTITVIENQLNAEKQYLPSTYVVNYWDIKSGDLKYAEAHQQTWQHVGRFDLPLGATVVTSHPGAAPASPLPGWQETKSLKLTNVHLNEATR